MNNMGSTHWSCGSCQGCCRLRPAAASMNSLSATPSLNMCTSALTTTCACLLAWQDLVDFVNYAWTPYHAVEETSRRLMQAGFQVQQLIASTISDAQCCSLASDAAATTSSILPKVAGLHEPRASVCCTCPHSTSARKLLGRSSLVASTSSPATPPPSAPLLWERSMSQVCDSVP